MTEITLDVAKTMLAAAEAKAEEISVPMCIAVADDGANLVASYRMDGGLLGSVDIARNKAYTAVSLETSTADLAEVARPDASLHGIETDNDSRFVIYGGGLPVTVGDRVVGGVGVSSGTVEEDEQVAAAGVEAFDGG